MAIRCQRVWLELVCWLSPVLIGARLGAAEATLEWPQFRGPGGRGVSADQRLPSTWSQTENLVWKTRLPGPGTSSPIVVGERLFLTCYSGYGVPDASGAGMDQLKRQMVCLDAGTGKV